MKAPALLVPVVRLMDRLPYTLKFALNGAVAGVVVAALLFIVVSERNAEVRVASREQVGVAYLGEVHAALLLLQQHRGLSATYLNGDAGARDKVTQKQIEVDKAFVALNEKGVRDDEVLHVKNELSKLAAAWNTLKQENFGLSSAQSFARHTELIENLISHIRYVADSSDMGLDPERLTFRMIDAGTNDLPEFIEASARLRGRAASLLAQRKLSDMDAIELRSLGVRARTSLRKLREGYERLVTLNGGQGSALRDAAIAIEKPLEEAIEAAERHVQSRAFDLSPQQMFAIASVPVNLGMALLDSNDKALDVALQARLQQAELKRTLTLGLTVGALALLGYLCLGAYLSMMNAIGQVVAGGQRLASGDLTAKIELDAHDEFRDIADSFNGIAEALHQVIKNVQNSAGRVAGAADDLAAMTQQISSSSTAQSESASAVAAAVEQVTVSIHSVADNAGEVDKKAQASLDNARKGNESLSQMMGEIGHVETAVGEIAGAVEGFVTSMRAITDMTRQVKDIADQTNLLALNAAIEAARAGEQGRGFAVVADEVRKLAEKSALAASEIDEVTRKLNSETGTVDTVIHRGLDSLQTSQSCLDRLAAVLAEASDSVAQTTSGMNEISSSVKEQTTASNEIARNVERIAQMAEENSMAVCNAAAGARELQSLADGLQSSIARFRV